MGCFFFSDPDAKATKDDEGEEEEEEEEREERDMNEDEYEEEEDEKIVPESKDGTKEVQLHDFKSFFL